VKKKHSIPRSLRKPTTAYKHPQRLRLERMDPGDAIMRLLQAMQNAAGLKQQQLSKRLRVHPILISQYHNGLKEPRISSLARIAAACGQELVLSFRPLPA